jgi:hypothetical protein
MAEPDILYAAIIVFVLLFIGLVLTVLEFKKILQKSKD